MSLAVSLGSAYLTYRALYPPPTVAKAAASLARAVKKTETAARRQLLAITMWPLR